MKPAFHLLYLILPATVYAVLPARKVAAQTAPALPPKSAATQDRAALLRNSLGKIPVKLDLKQQSLSDMIDALCRQAHCNIMVDDDPILAKADLKFDGTASAALDQIADAFDYTWEASQHGGVLLRKAFRNPLEHPQINLPELRRAAHDALTTLSAVAYDTFDHKQDWLPIIHDMVASFTPEQWHTLTDNTVPQNKRRMTMQQMTATQRGQLVQAMRRGNFHNLVQGWQEMAAGLDNLPDVQLTLRRDDPIYTLNAQKGPVSIAVISLTYPRTGGASNFEVRQVHIPVDPATGKPRNKPAVVPGEKETRQ